MSRHVNPDDKSEASEICLPPSAVDLLESMRAIGYTFEAALADIVDNSISAGASTVDIRFSPFESPFVAVLDDGRGMTGDELTTAMRHGSSDPNLARKFDDLGRFGLGLKTASLSQCRVLTCISLKDGLLNGRCWDLDHVAKRQDWMLLSLSEAQIKRLPLVEALLKLGNGTIVLWQSFDRLAAGESSIERALGARMDTAREHLSLVFHRFLRRKPGVEALTISINQNPLLPLDPFLSDLKGTQQLQPQRFQIQGEVVTVLPFILPHISKLKPADLALAGGEEGLRRNQGFYVYRNGRLISWGCWFRLVRQEELTKLARVQVDITNRLDHLWKLDIKKSAAFPPEALREGLKQIISRITEGSRRVYTYRGKRSSPDSVVHAWDRTLVRDGVAYRVNRQHPMIMAIESLLPQQSIGLFDRFLKTLETTLPLDSIYADLASDLRPPELATLDDYAQMKLLASNILNTLGADTEAGRQFLSALPSIEPFSNRPDDAVELARTLLNGHE